VKATSTCTMCVWFEYVRLMYM